MSLFLKILYEDEDVLAIDKPSGLMVHPDGRSSEPTVTDWVIEHYPELKGVGEPVRRPADLGKEEIDRPGIVHRLDRETSGVLIIVKNAKAFAYYKKQFMGRKIRKTYAAIVYGHPNLPADGGRGVIDKPIGRSPRDFRRRLAGRGARGELREAVTEYKVLKRFTDKEGNKFSYLEVYPKTGRTHQIRVHLKYLSYPIVCDSLYAPDKPCPAELGRLALHARSIEFKTPGGKTVKVESPLPKEFKKFTGLKN